METKPPTSYKKWDIYPIDMNGYDSYYDISWDGKHHLEKLVILQASTVSIHLSQHFQAIS